MRFKISVLFIFSLLLILTCFIACQTEDKITVAIVTVKNELGNPIPGATVRIFQDTIKNEQGVEAGISNEEITGANGESIHVLPDIEAILFLEAKHADLQGLDVIRINPLEQNEKTIIIK